MLLFASVSPIVSVIGKFFAYSTWSIGWSSGATQEKAEAWEENSSAFLRVHCCSVTKSYLTLCNPMDCSTPGFPAHHQLPEITQLMSIELAMPSMISSFVALFSSCLQSMCRSTPNIQMGQSKRTDGGHIPYVKYLKIINQLWKF